MPMLDAPDTTPVRLLTATSLAEYLSVSLSTIRRMTRDGEIPAVRIRTAIRFDPEAVVRWLTDYEDDEPWGKQGSA